MIGRKLSHYEVMESLGSGGMGEVYRARDNRLGRDVAIKVLPPDRTLDQTSRLRFQREAMAASALNHPNIITIYEINTEGDTDYIAMEYVRGMTLSTRLKRSPLTPEEAIGYASQIADALAKAHAAGIVHRDIKPGNVMITEDHLVKVLDFGLAKFEFGGLETISSSGSGPVAANNPISLPWAIAGTIAYMSPEQARGDLVDSRSDIFSFGTMLFEMLSGELPFPGTNAMGILHNIHFSPPRDLLDLRPGTPPALANLVMHMLQKKPEARPASMAEVANQLRAGSRATGSAPSWHSSELNFPRQGGMERVAPNTALGKPGYRWPLWGAACLLVIAAVGAGGYLYKKKMQAKPVAATTANAPLEGDAFALYKRGREELDHFERPGAKDRAIASLEKAVALDPQSAASFAALALAYDLKNSENADPQWIKLTAQSAKRALELNPDLSASHLAMGLSEMQAGHTSESEKEFRKAADLDPKSGTPYRWIGILYDNKGERGKAHAALTRALELEPNDWRNYMEQAFNEFQSADYKSAAGNWEHALKLEPDNIDALVSLGGVYHVLGRDDDAATVLQRALEIHPDADTYTNLGNVRYFQGRYLDAAGSFEKAVALGANRHERWGNLGDAYRWAPGQAEKSAPAYQQAIQLVREELVKSPEQPDLRANLALYLAKSGDKEGALKELHALEQKGNQEPAVLYSMALAYEICHERNKALQELEASLEKGQSMTDVKSEPELAALRADPQYHLRILSAHRSSP